MKFIFGILVLLFVAVIVNTDPHIRIFLQKCAGTCNPKYCNITNVCRPYNRTAKPAALDIYFHSGIILNAPLLIEIQGNKKFATQFRPFMIKVKEELCQFLLVRDHILFQLNNSPTVMGNLADPCPFSGHRYLHNSVATDYSKWPLVPVGEWRLDYIISQNVNGTNEHIVSWFDFYEVKPTGVIEF